MTKLTFDWERVAWVCDKCWKSMTLPGIAPDLQMLIDHDWKYCPHCGEKIDYKASKKGR